MIHQFDESGKKCICPYSNKCCAVAIFVTYNFTGFVNIVVVYVVTAFTLEEFGLLTGAELLIQHLG
jgi:hypothetical protein